jgi:hypothetical protein
LLFECLSCSRFTRSWRSGLDDEEEECSATEDDDEGDRDGEERRDVGFDCENEVGDEDEDEDWAGMGSYPTLVVAHSSFKLEVGSNFTLVVGEAERRESIKLYVLPSSTLVASRVACRVLSVLHVPLCAR